MIELDCDQGFGHAGGPTLTSAGDADWVGIWTESSGEVASTRPRGKGKAAPKASAMVLPPDATVALFTFCSVHNSTWASLAARTIRSAERLALALANNAVA